MYYLFNFMEVNIRIRILIVILYVYPGFICTFLIHAYLNCDFQSNVSAKVMKVFQFFKVLGSDLCRRYRNWEENDKERIAIH